MCQFRVPPRHRLIVVEATACTSGRPPVFPVRPRRGSGRSTPGGCFCLPGRRHAEARCRNPPVRCRGLVTCRLPRQSVQLVDGHPDYVWKIVISSAPPCGPAGGRSLPHPASPQAVLLCPACSSRAGVPPAGRPAEVRLGTPGRDGRSTRFEIRCEYAGGAGCAPWSCCAGGAVTGPDHIRSTPARAAAPRRTPLRQWSACRCRSGTASAWRRRESRRGFACCGGCGICAAPPVGPQRAKLLVPGVRCASTASSPVTSAPTAPLAGHQADIKSGGFVAA